jgi:nucleotide-binding universal stress UspA family protein
MVLLDKPTTGEILVATDFSPASQNAVLCASSFARRWNSKLFLVHIVGSRNENTVMDAWRTGQAEITRHFIANNLDGIHYELIVRPGEIWEQLSALIRSKEISLVVVGTRGRTGMRKLVLGSVAESIFRRAPCPAISVGPKVSSEVATRSGDKILVATGLAAHSTHAVPYAARLASGLGSSLALINVVTELDPRDSQETVRRDRERILRGLIDPGPPLQAPPEFFVEFGSAAEQIVKSAATWNASLVVLGLREVEETSRKESTWAKAYDVISKATCPVLTLRSFD